MPSGMTNVSDIVCCFGGNTRTCRGLRLRRPSNRAVTYGNALMHTDGDVVRGGEGPDASSGCRSRCRGRRQGQQQ